MSKGRVFSDKSRTDALKMFEAEEKKDSRKVVEELDKKKKKNKKNGK